LKQNWKYIMNVMLALFGLGGSEALLIFAAFLLLFGAKKLPELAKGLGTGIKEFKKATREVTDEIQNPPPEASQTKVTGNPPSQPQATVAQTTQEKIEHTKIIN
jgi:sec-independent protein translocase protein TatA